MHRILKQTVELSIDHQADALAVQDRISRECQGGGLLELERVFDRLAGDKVVRVGRMELDLGEIGGDDWLTEFLRRLAQCAERTLAQAASGSVVGGMSTADDNQTGLVESLSERSPAQARLEALASFLRLGRLPWWSDLVLDEARVRSECATLTAAGKRSLIKLVTRYPRALQRLVIHLQAREVEQLLLDDLPPALAGRLAKASEQLESYLALPSLRASEWRAAYWQPFFRFVQESPTTLEPETVVRCWFSSLEALLPHSVEKLHRRLDAPAFVLALPPEWQQAFGKILRRAAAGRLRGARPTEQAPDATGGEKPPTAGAAQTATPQSPGALGRPAPDAGVSPPPAAGSAQAPMLQSPGALGRPALDAGVPHPPAAGSAQASTPQGPGALGKPAPDAGVSRSPAAGSAQASMPQSPGALGKPAPDAGVSPPPTAGSAQTSTPQGPGALGGPAPDAGVSPPPTEGAFSLGEPDDVEVEALYVTGAGMVLLHPFLGELFAHLGLVEEGQFVDEDARQVAVRVLGYLGFGSQERVETELTLAKLLCGMPLNEVLLPVNLSAAALEGADELLAAVLKHWAALKSSSVQWLREQFILRTGKLEQVDAGWKLVIESRAQDVLLAKLPWGFGVFSLPWLSAMLYVSWGD